MKQKGKEEHRAARHIQPEPDDANGAEEKQSPPPKKTTLEQLLGHSFTVAVDKRMAQHWDGDCN